MNETDGLAFIDGIRSKYGSRITGYETNEQLIEIARENGWRFLRAPTIFPEQPTGKDGVYFSKEEAHELVNSGGAMFKPLFVAHQKTGDKGYHGCIVQTSTDENHNVFLGTFVFENAHPNTKNICQKFDNKELTHFSIGYKFNKLSPNNTEKIILEVSLTKNPVKKGAWISILHSNDNMEATTTTSSSPSADSPSSETTTLTSSSQPVASELFGLPADKRGEAFAKWQHENNALKEKHDLAIKELEETRKQASLSEEERKFAQAYRESQAKKQEKLVEQRKAEVQSYFDLQNRIHPDRADDPTTLESNKILSELAVSQDPRDQAIYRNIICQNKADLQAAADAKEALEAAHQDLQASISYAKNAESLSTSRKRSEPPSSDPASTQAPTPLPSLSFGKFPEIKPSSFFDIRKQASSIVTHSNDHPDETPAKQQRTTNTTSSSSFSPTSGIVQHGLDGKFNDYFNPASKDYAGHFFDPRRPETAFNGRTSTEPLSDAVSGIVTHSNDSADEEYSARCLAKMVPRECFEEFNTNLAYRNSEPEFDPTGRASASISFFSNSPLVNAALDTGGIWQQWIPTVWKHPNALMPRDETGQITVSDDFFKRVPGTRSWNETRHLEAKNELAKEGIIV